MMRIAATFATAVTLVALALAPTVRHATPALACTPGPPFGLEGAALADAIVLAEAVSVGSAVNSAPTVTPTLTNGTATPAPVGSDTPVPTATPYSFDLTGYGATLRVLDVLAGNAPETLVADAEGRAFMEREVRRREAYRGPPTIFSNCPIEWSAHQYKTGQRYLVFLTRTDTALSVLFRYRIEGTELALAQYPRSDSWWNLEALGMTEPTYQRYFPGIPAEILNGVAIITAGRVPLASVLRAVAALRGDPSIAPPETGSAGLAANR